MSKKKKYSKKNNKQTKVIAITFLILVVLFGLFISKSDLLKPKLNLLTAHYISFNNLDSTDSIKIRNLKIRKNNSTSFMKKDAYQKFDITGDKYHAFQIELYSIGNSIDEKYVHYSLFKNNRFIKSDVLSNSSETIHAGRVIYQDKILEKDEWMVQMWIDSSYEGELDSVSYEVKIGG